MFNTIKEFYLLDKDELKDHLYFSEEEGLSSREARRRLSQFGENKIKERKKRSLLSIFINQFRDFMIVVLRWLPGFPFLWVNSLMA